MKIVLSTKYENNSKIRKQTRDCEHLYSVPQPKIYKFQSPLSFRIFMFLHDILE